MKSDVPIPMLRPHALSKPQQRESMLGPSVPVGWALLHTRALPKPCPAAL